MKLSEIIIYPFKQEKFWVKIAPPLIILIAIGYSIKYLKISSEITDILYFFIEWLIFGYITIFAHNIINNIFPSIPDFIKNLFAILKHGFILSILVLLFGNLITVSITNKIQVGYLTLIPLSLLIIPFAFCMYAYKLSLKEFLKINNVKTAIKTVWNIKFLYLKSIFISILIIILIFLLGVVMYAIAPITEELHSNPSIFLVGLMCTSLFAHLFKYKVLNELEDIERGRN